MWISVSLITEGDKDISQANYNPTWKLHRKLAFQSLRNFMTGDKLEVAVYDSFEKMATYLDKQSEPIGDMRRYLQFMMYSTLSKICMSHEYDGINDEEFVAIQTAMDDVNDVIFQGVLEDVFPYLLPIWKSQNYRKVERQANLVSSILEKYVTEHSLSLDMNNPRNIVDHLLIAQKNIDKEDPK